MSNDIIKHYDEPHTWQISYVKMHKSRYDGYIPVTSTTSKFKAWWWRRQGWMVVTIMKRSD